MVQTAARALQPPRRAVRAMLQCAGGGEAGARGGGGGGRFTPASDQLHPEQSSVTSQHGPPGLVTKNSACTTGIAASATNSASPPHSMVISQSVAGNATIRTEGLTLPWRLNPAALRRPGQPQRAHIAASTHLPGWGSSTRCGCPDSHVERRYAEGGPAWELGVLGAGCGARCKASARRPPARPGGRWAARPRRRASAVLLWLPLRLPEHAQRPKHLSWAPCPLTSFWKKLHLFEALHEALA